MRFAFCNILLAVTFSLGAQIQKKHYEDKFITVDYRIKDGLLDGKYTSKYRNGKKKAEGLFKNNLRIGKWQLWDSAGIRIEYTVKSDSISKGDQGFFPFTNLKEKDIYMDCRIWRKIPKEQNSLLFASPFFCDSLYKFMVRDSLALYKDEDLFTRIDSKDLKKVFEENSFEIVSYRLKEDWFIDKSQMRAIVRPIALCPIVKARNSELNETFSLGWFYYPDLRPFLALQKIEKKETPIKSLDDVFWYRYFFAPIYKEANMYESASMQLIKNESEAEHEQQRVEIGLIEWEHYFWLHPDKQPLRYGYVH